MSGAQEIPGAGDYRRAQNALFRYLGRSGQLSAADAWIRFQYVNAPGGGMTEAQAYKIRECAQACMGALAQADYCLPLPPADWPSHLDYDHFKECAAYWSRKAFEVVAHG